MNDNLSPNHKQNYTTILTLVSSATANSSRRISGVTMITRVRHHFSNTFAQRPSTPAAPNLPGALFICLSVLEWYWSVPRSGCFENKPSSSETSAPVDSSISSLEINKASSFSEGAAILLNAHFHLDVHKNSNKAHSEKRANKHIKHDVFLLISLAWPDRFFPVLFVVFSATTNKNGKKRSGHARLLCF